MNRSKDPTQRLSVSFQLALKWVLLLAIRLYQSTVSLFFGGSCRYYPTCSHYAGEAFQCLPPGQALKLTLIRLSKCHPFGGKGYDPVPCHKDKIKEGKNE